MQNLTQMLMQQWGRGDVRQFFNRHSLMLTSSAMLAMLLVGCEDGTETEAEASEDEVDRWEYSLTAANPGPDGDYNVTVAVVVKDYGDLILLDNTSYSLHEADYPSVGHKMYVITYNGDDTNAAYGLIGYKITADELADGIISSSDEIVQIQAVASYEGDKTIFEVVETEGDVPVQRWEHTGDDWTTGWRLSDLPVGEQEIYFSVRDGESLVFYDAVYENGNFWLQQTTGSHSSGWTVTIMDDFVIVPVIQEYVMDSGSLTVVNYTIYASQDDLDNQNSLGVVSVATVNDGSINILMGQSVEDSIVMHSGTHPKIFIISALDGSDFTVDQAAKSTVYDDRGSALAVADLFTANYNDDAYAVVQIEPAEGIADISVNVTPFAFSDDNSHTSDVFARIYTDFVHAIQALGGGDPHAYVASVVDTADNQLMLGILEPQADGRYTGLARFENDEGEKEVDGYVWISYDGTNFKTTMVHDTLDVCDFDANNVQLDSRFGLDDPDNVDGTYNFTQFSGTQTSGLPNDYFDNSAGEKEINVLVQGYADIQTAATLSFAGSSDGLTRKIMADGQISSFDSDSVVNNENILMFSWQEDTIEGVIDVQKIVSSDLCDDGAG